MGSVSFFVFFVLSHLLLLHSAQEEMIPSPSPKPNPKCPPFPCGELGLFGFPFTKSKNPECGLFILHHCDGFQTPKVQLEKNGKLYDVEWIHPPYDVEGISQANHTIGIKDEELSDHLNEHSCESFRNLTIPRHPPCISFQIREFNIKTLFKCERTGNNTLQMQTETEFSNYFNYTNCSNYDIYYYSQSDSVVKLPKIPPPQCSIIWLPLLFPEVETPGHEHGADLFKLLGAVFPLEVGVSADCFDCHLRGGLWLTNNITGKYYCTIAEKDNKRIKMVLGLSIGLPGILIIVCCFFIRRHYKKKHASTMLARNISSRSDMEGGSFYFGTSVFAYSELKEATNNFDIEKELGDGGFGTVYYGKLRDGREVAVKRLYEHNYRRVEQFMNEIEILTKLRHKNLVSLYGCTSRHSRELLLVYEYIPNGTVADHIHGERATPGSPTWPTRMSIAIETASALAYLHASDIIHRDVKTNNILLDNSFCVKVADFGLSRLFPTNVTHVSTAPQGTPGYVDPEYHQRYQLTIKSDVYSFGVVLIELISSLPAVDITRHWNEINLANLAINKIQNCEFNELIDLHLGFESDNEVKRMTISVANLAFQCLQPDKETRPSMVEVLEALKKIQSGEDESEDREKADDDAGVLKPPTSPDSYEAGLLKKTQLLPPSPDSVTDIDGVEGQLHLMPEEMLLQ